MIGWHAAQTNKDCSYTKEPEINDAKALDFVVAELPTKEAFAMPKT